MAAQSTDVKEIIMPRYDAADRWLENKRVLWDKIEDIARGKLGDNLSGGTKSQVFDPILETLSFERSHRVMAQLATGKVKAISKNDEGASQLMNLSLDKYVVPNANAQFDFLTKCRMVDAYSNMYGGFGALVDWDTKKNGYIGPDMWLIPIRDVFPQVGAVSVGDSDHIIIRSWRAISFFEGLADNKDCINIPAIIEKLKEKSGDKQNRDSKAITQREQGEFPVGQPGKGDGFFEVLSMYEGDRWIDYVVAAELPFRDTGNPHDNGELPIVWKYSVPLLDDIIGRGDYERGMPMQFTVNSLWNLYLDAVKVSIFPPVVFDKNAIADSASIKWGAAAKWMMKGNPVNAAQVLNLTPQGISTFNTVMGAAKGSILNQFGTTDTTMTAQQDPGFGKTPQALKQQNARENARDTADRFYMEQFVSGVSKKFVNLLSKKADKVQFRMFEEEIDELGKQYPEILDMYDQKTGKLTIDKKTTGSIVYDYEIVAGSTYAVDQKEQQQTLVDLFKAVTENLSVNPQTGEATSPLMAALKAQGRVIDLGEWFTRIIASSGIQDWDKIIQDKKNDAESILNQHATQFQQALTAMGGPGAIPPMPQAGGPQMPGQPMQPQGQPMQQMPQPGMPQPMPQNLTLNTPGAGPAGQPLPPQMQGGING